MKMTHGRVRRTKNTDRRNIVNKLATPPRPNIPAIPNRVRQGPPVPSNSPKPPAVDNSPPLPLHVDDPTRYLIDNGILFFINCEFLHPMNMALAVKKDRTITVMDFSDNPEGATFPPEVYERGKSNWDRFYAQEGLPATTKRLEELGFITQNRADFKQMPAYRENLKKKRLSRV